MSNVEVEGVVAGEATPEVAAPVVAAVQTGNIPGTVFVEVWNTSNSRKEVLARFKELGYTLEYGSLGARVKSFIAKGVKLKEMPREKTKGRKGKTLDVSKLNAVADAIAQKLADAAKVAAAAAETPAEGEATPAS